MPWSRRPPPAQAADEWETTVFAKVPSPGFPAYVFVHRNKRVYAGTYAAVAASTPSRVFEWSRHGTLLRSWAVPGQQPGAEHGVQVRQPDPLRAAGRARHLDLDGPHPRHPDRAVADGRPPARRRAQLRHLGPGRGALRHRLRRRPDLEGRPPGPGQGVVHLPALQGAETFGTTGIVFRKRERDLLITQQTTADGGGVTPTQGFLYRLPVKRGGRPARSRRCGPPSRATCPTASESAGGPGTSTSPWRVLSNQIVEIDANGNEVDRFPDQPAHR